MPIAAPSKVALNNSSLFRRASSAFLRLVISTLNPTIRHYIFNSCKFLLKPGSLVSIVLGPLAAMEASGDGSWRQARQAGTVLACPSAFCQNPARHGFTYTPKQLSNLFENSPLILACHGIFLPHLYIATFCLWQDKNRPYLPTICLTG